MKYCETSNIPFSIKEIIVNGTIISEFINHLSVAPFGYQNTYYLDNSWYTVIAIHTYRSI